MFDVIIMTSTPNNSYIVHNAGYHRHEVQFKGELKGTKHVYRFEMPVVTVDLVVFNKNKTHVLMMRRGPRTQPKQFQGFWAIPGGHLEKGELGHIGAQRELKEETGLSVPLTEITLFDVATEPDRDPRQWTVGLIYTTCLNQDIDIGTLVPEDEQEVSGITWVSVADIMYNKVILAFDHKRWVISAYKSAINKK